MSAGRGVQLIQRKKTIYPEWNTCFDAHLYEGRVIQMIVLQRPNVFVADTNIAAQVLADKCQDGGVCNVQVRTLIPSLKSIFRVRLYSVKFFCIPFLGPAPACNGQAPALSFLCKQRTMLVVFSRLAPPTVPSNARNFRRCFRNF